ncbi:MAG: zinc ABC transporter substrate-binding protein [Cypionkella sp.]
MRVLTLVLAILTTPALAEVPTVETDIPPVAALVAQVMGDLGTPGMMLDKGGDEHDMQLRPSQMREINAANLLIWVGPELTLGLDQARKFAPDLQSLALLDDPKTLRLDYSAGGVNPHAWLDPANARIWVDLIADRLASLDPDNAATYRTNAATAQARIATLDASLAAKLAPLTRPFVTYHDAYGYIARAYHLPYLGGLAAGDAAPPGAARISDLHAKVASGAIACAFPEAQHDPALINSLAQGTKLFIGPALDPVGSTLDPGPDAYETLMTRLTDALVTCAANSP